MVQLKNTKVSNRDLKSARKKKSPTKNKSTGSNSGMITEETLFYPAKLTFKNKGERMAFSEKKSREFTPQIFMKGTCKGCALERRKMTPEQVLRCEKE